MCNMSNVYFYCVACDFLLKKIWFISIFQLFLVFLYEATFCWYFMCCDYVDLFDANAASKCTNNLVIDLDLVRLFNRALCSMLKVRVKTNIQCRSTPKIWSWAHHIWLILCFLKDRIFVKCSAEVKKESWKKRVGQKKCIGMETACSQWENATQNRNSSSGYQRPFAVLNSTLPSMRLLFVVGK